MRSPTCCISNSISIALALEMDIRIAGPVAGGGDVFLPPPTINCAGISLCQGRFLNEVPKPGLVSWQALDMELVSGHHSQVDATTRRCRW